MFLVFYLAVAHCWIKCPKVVDFTYKLNFHLTSQNFYSGAALEPTFGSFLLSFYNGVTALATVVLLLMWKDDWTGSRKS